MDFFSKTEPMRGMQGDTFPTFFVFVNGMSLTGCSMRLVLEQAHRPGTAVLTKNCTHFTRSDGKEGYMVRLDSSETASLLGLYTLHFILTDSNEREYRKLVGKLEVLDTPDEPVEEGD